MSEVTDENLNKTLHRCYCGNAPKILFTSERRLFDDETEYFGAQVCCDKCGAKSRLVPIAEMPLNDDGTYCYQVAHDEWNARPEVVPELPRVSPENLVEGEWYVVGDVPTWYYCGRFHTFFKDGTSRIGFWPEEGIHGPLKFRIGGAE